VPIILHTYCKTKDSLKILQELADIIKMVEDLAGGYMGFNEKICANAMKSMLPII